MCEHSSRHLEQLEGRATFLTEMGDARKVAFGVAGAVALFYNMQPRDLEHRGGAGS